MRFMAAKDINSNQKEYKSYHASLVRYRPTFADDDLFFDKSALNNTA